MAATTIGRQVTEAHRAAQARLAAQTALAVRAAFGLLDPEDLDGSTERWLRAVVPIVTGQRVKSATLAANYMTAFKSAEVGVGSRVALVLADQVPVQQVITSMTVTGPVSVKRAMTRLTPLDTAVSTAQANTARSGIRLALGGGRDTVIETVAADRQASGWARVASGRPCAFCAMLASRGAVYDRGSSAFHAHDGCSCSAEPVYRTDSALPPSSERWAAMWDEAQRGDGDPVKNFQALVEAA